MSNEQFSTGGVSWIADWPMTEQQVIDVVKTQEARIAELTEALMELTTTLEQGGGYTPQAIDEMEQVFGGDPGQPGRVLRKAWKTLGIHQEQGQ